MVTNFSCVCVFRNTLQRSSNAIRVIASSKGFTLSELLVAIAISGIVLATVYSSFYSQQKSCAAQEQITAMDQNLRAAMYLLKREIRMAGYDPTGYAGAGISVAATNSIRLLKDITDNTGSGVPDGDTADPNEDVIYALFDADGDGDMDLGRNDVNGVGNQPVAENIDALNFVYLDKTGTPTTLLPKIRSVQITVLARAAKPDQGYSNATVYKNQQGQTIFIPPTGDGYRRQLSAALVECRNLGL